MHIGIKDKLTFYHVQGNWTLAEKCLTDASTVLVTRMVSHPTEKEELTSIVNDIKGRIAEHKEMEKGVFSEVYVAAPGINSCKSDHLY